jgi:hypothetical protein
VTSSPRRLASVYAWVGLPATRGHEHPDHPLLQLCPEGMTVVAGVVTGISSVLQARMSTYFGVVSIPVALAAGFFLLLVMNPPII